MGKVFIEGWNVDGYGYTCSDHGDAKIYSTFWSKNCKQTFISNSKLEMYETSKTFVNSLYAHLTQLHIAKYEMCVAFISWYETPTHNTRFSLKNPFKKGFEIKLHE
jgi:hypothetical protein